MAYLQPAYRATIYELTGGVPLTPVSGHSDNFRVATIAGVSGYQPYLELPKGRRGRIDFLDRVVETGELTLRVLDKDAQTSGWVTAFAGDSNGLERFGGKMVFVEESTDGGGSWSPFFTGRVHSVRVSRLHWEFRVRDMLDEMRRPVFQSRPDPSITYARSTSIYPVGMTESYANVETIPKRTGTVETWGWGTFNSVTQIACTPGQYADQSGARKYADLVTKAFHDSYQGQGTKLSWLFANAVNPDEVRIRLEITSGARAGETGHFHLATRQGYPPVVTKAVDGFAHRVADTIAITPVSALDSEYLALPPANESVEFDIIWAGKPSERAPLYLDDVHPVTLAKDMLEGRFGRFDVSGNRAWQFYPTSSFSTLAADTSIPTGRFTITEEVDDMIGWIEEYILKPYGLAMYIDANGQPEIVDLRLTPSTASGASTLTNADLVAGEAPRKTFSRREAVTRVDAFYYVEREVTEREVAQNTAEYPDFVAARIDAERTPLVVLDFTDTLLKENTWEVDGLGYRAFLEEGQGEDEAEKRLSALVARLQRAITETRGPYIAGAAYYSLPCRRTATVASLSPGDVVIVDVDEFPDPASRTRGGARLARVAGVEERGLTVNVDLLDLGPNSVSVVPTFGTPTQTTNETEFSIDVPVTLNASGEPAILEIATTDTATGVRPAEGSDRWVFAALVTSSGTVSVPGRPSGRRGWIRARSQTIDGDAVKLPSAWAFPTPGYIDTTGLTAPSGVSASGVTASTATIAWTNGNADVEVEVWLDQGGDEDMVVRLEPGSNEIELFGLDASTSYTAKIRHRDPEGGVSSFATVAFSTTSTNPDCPRMIGLAVLAGERV